MDDMMSSLSDFLSTDEGRNTVEMLKNMFASGGQSPPDQSSSPPKNNAPDFDMGKIAELMSAFSQARADSDAENLLLAISPHLSQKRRDRVPGAIKLLKLASVIPLLSKTDILSGLL